MVFKVLNIEENSTFKTLNTWENQILLITGNMERSLDKRDICMSSGENTNLIILLVKSLYQFYNSDY